MLSIRPSNHGLSQNVRFNFDPWLIHIANAGCSKAIRTSHVLGRPLRLLSPPIEVVVQRETIADRELAFCKPVQVAFNNGVNRTSQEIVRSWGPERIETGWWHGATVQRDYWSIVTQAGTQFWVFCDLKQRKWFVHGEF